MADFGIWPESSEVNIFMKWTEMLSWENKKQWRYDGRMKTDKTWTGNPARRIKESFLTTVERWHAAEVEGGRRHSRLRQNIEKNLFYWELCTVRLWNSRKSLCSVGGESDWEVWWMRNQTAYEVRAVFKNTWYEGPPCYHFWCPFFVSAELKTGKSTRAQATLVLVVTLLLSIRNDPSE